MGQCQIYIAIALFGIIKSISCQDFSLNLISRVPDGVAGVDYPQYTSVPRRLSFTCRDRKPGFYADPETRCQVWHWCDTYNIKHSFICSNMTLFNQKIRGCDWWYNVDCDLATSQYSNNDELYVTSKPQEQSDQERRHANDDQQRRQKQLEDDAAAAAEAAAVAATAATIATDLVTNDNGLGNLPANNAHQPPPESAVFDNSNNINNHHQQDGVEITFASTTHPFPAPAVSASVAPVVHQFATPSTAPRGFQQVRPLTNRFPGSPNNFISNIPNAIPIAFPPPPAPRPVVQRVFTQTSPVAPSSTAVNFGDDSTSGISTLTAEDNLLGNDFQVDNEHTNFGSFEASTLQQQSTTPVQQQPEVFTDVTNHPEVPIRQRVPSARGRPGTFQGPFFSSSTASSTISVPAPTTTTPAPVPSATFDFGLHVDPVTNRIFTVALNNNIGAFNSVAPPVAETVAPFVPFNHFSSQSDVGGLFTTSANAHSDDAETPSVHDDMDDVDDANRDFQRFNSVPAVPLVNSHHEVSNNELFTVTDQASPSTINLDEFFAETAPLSPSPPPQSFASSSSTLPPPPTPRQSQFRPFSARGTAPPRHQASARPTFQTSPPTPPTIVTTQPTASATSPSSSQLPKVVDARPVAAATPAPFNLAVPFGARLRHVVAPDPSNGLDQSPNVRRHDSSASSSTKRSASDLSTGSTTSRQIVVRSSSASAITSGTTTVVSPSSTRRPTTAPPTTTTTTTPLPTTTEDATTEFDDANALPSTTVTLRRRKLVTSTVRGGTFPPFPTFSTTTLVAPSEEASSDSEATTTEELNISTTPSPLSPKSLRGKRRKIRTSTTAPLATTATESNELESSASSSAPAVRTVSNATAASGLSTTVQPTRLSKTTLTSSSPSSRSAPTKRRTFPSFPITTFRPSTPFQLQSRGRVVDGHFGERQQRHRKSTTIRSTNSSESATTSANENLISNNDVTPSR